jgi:hypothetical protein
MLGLLSPAICCGYDEPIQLDLTCTQKFVASPKSGSARFLPLLFDKASFGEPAEGAC